VFGDYCGATVKEKELSIIPYMDGLTFRNKKSGRGLARKET
jgi:hypothetical protein